MGHSQHVRFRDLRNAYRLIGECRDFGGDSQAWRSHLIQGLCRLLGARVAIAGEARWVGLGADRTLAPLGAVDFGWESSAARARWVQYMVDHDIKRDPVHREIARIHARHIVRSRDQLLDDDEWYASTQFNEYHRVSRVDHFLISYHAMEPAEHLSCIGVYRAVGDRPFEARQRRVVHLLHAELTLLTGRVLAPAAADGPLAGPALSPRLRQTLMYLLEGDSEKQAAVRMGISRATVHQYVMALYRHYGVGSRAELMARWVRPIR